LSPPPEQLSGRTYSGRQSENKESLRFPFIRKKVDNGEEPNRQVTVSDQSHQVFLPLVVRGQSGEWQNCNRWIRE